MFKVYFENSLGQETEIAIVNTEAEILIVIKKFLESHNYKSYYIRTWQLDDGSIKYAIGSWNEFFRSKEVKK